MPRRAGPMRSVMPARLRELFLALLLTLALAGCSAVRIVYNQADTLAYWMADEYFDLDGPQKDAVRAELDHFHAWHRTHELPAYVALLRDMRAKLDRSLQREDVAWVVEAVKARYQVLVRHESDRIAPLLATLADPQLRAVEKQFAKTNRKYEKEHGVGAPPAEQRKLRLKRFVERIEHWTGSLTDEQVARLGLAYERAPLLAELRHRDRQRRQAEFLELLRERRAPEFPAKLRAWLVGWDQGRSPEYERAVAEFAERSADMYLAVERVLTTAQRHRLTAKVEAYIADFTALAAERSRPLAAQ